MGDEEQGEYKVVWGDEEPVAFLSPEKEGAVSISYPSGATFVGTVIAAKKEGFGTYCWKNKEDEEDILAQYEGEYVANARSGLGKMSWKDGSFYHGMWKNNQKSGEGTYFYANGDIYSGSWKADNKVGAGTYEFASDKSQLIGQWEEDGSITEGVWKFSSGGCVTAGKFIDGKPVGDGNFLFSDGVVNTHSQTGTFSGEGAFLTWVPSITKNVEEDRPEPAEKDPLELTPEGAALDSLFELWTGVNTASLNEAIAEYSNEEVLVAPVADVIDKKSFREGIAKAVSSKTLAFESQLTSITVALSRNVQLSQLFEAWTAVAGEITSEEYNRVIDKHNGDEYNALEDDEARAEFEGFVLRQIPADSTIDVSTFRTTIAMQAASLSGPDFSDFLNKITECYTPVAAADDDE